jgi:cytochrome c peroxidase
MKFIFLFFIPFLAFSQESQEQRLKQYIQDFNLTSVRSPGVRNQQLFILGRSLFHERGLSGNNNIRCEDCHHPRIGLGDGLPLALGEGATGFQMGGRLRLQESGKVLARNSTALFNLHHVNVMFWDGRVEFHPETKSFTTPVPLRADIASTLKSALAAQAIFPMVDHAEMRGRPGSNPIADAANEHEAWDLIVEKILKIPGYQEAFATVFRGEKINIGHLGEALAHFQSHAFYFTDTPFDRYIQGEVTALTPKEKLGMDVFFGKGRCGECHHGENLSALDYDSIAVPQIGPGKINGDDLGRFHVDGEEDSKYAFRVPPLRNVALTAPYMHNGVFKTLAEVVHHYDDIRASLEGFKILEQWKNYSSSIEDHDHSSNETRYIYLPEDLDLKLNLTQFEKEALVEFLEVSLTDVRLRGR